MTGLEAVRALFAKVDAECGGYKPEKKKYFYNDDNDVVIIDEKTLEEAEAGKNYLASVSSWWDLGEFETAEQAQRKYFDIKAEERYFQLNDC